MELPTKIADKMHKTQANNNSRHSIHTSNQKTTAFIHIPFFLNFLFVYFIKIENGIQVVQKISWKYWKCDKCNNTYGSKIYPKRFKTSDRMTAARIFHCSGAVNSAT